MKKSLITLAVAASLAALSGCGSEGSDEYGAAEDATGYFVSGTAAKGIIKNARVVAREYSTTDTSLTIVGQTTTDENGEYSLQLSNDYAGGVVRLTMSAGTNTTMTCDAIDGCNGVAFGGSVAMTDFTLTSIVQPVSANVTVPITPLTHMVTRRALSGGTPDATSVAMAISELSQIVGVDIMSTEIVDVTNASALSSASENAKKLSIFNAGLANLILGGSNFSSMQTNLANLASSFADGDFDDNDPISIATIMASVDSAASGITAAVIAANSDLTLTDDDITALLEDAVDEVETTVDLINGVTVDGTYDPEPSETADQDAITQAKALVTEARTFIEKIESDFSDPLDAFSIDAEAVSDVLSSDTAVMSALLGEVLDQVLTDIDNKVEAGDISTVDIQEDASTETTTAIMDGESIVGTITTILSQGDTGITLTMVGEVSGNGDVTDDDGIAVAPQTVTIDLEIATNITVDDLTIIDGDLITAITTDTAELSLSGTIANSEDQVTAITLTDASLLFTATEPVVMDMTDDADNDDLISYLDSASFSGTLNIMSNGANFDGDAEITLVSLEDSSAADVPLSLSTIAVNGMFTNADSESFTAGVTLEIENATSFDTFGYLDYEATAFAEVDFEYILSDADLAIIEQAISDWSDFLAANGNQTAADTVASIDATSADLSNYSGFYNVVDTSSHYLGSAITELPDLEAALLAGAQELYSTEILTSTFDYLIYDNSENSGRASVQLSLADFEDVDNFVQGTLTVTATLDVAELPEATAIATASRTELAGGDANVTISYDGSSFTLRVDSEDLDAQEAQVTLSVTNPDGVEMMMVLTENADGDYEINGRVSVDGTEVGSIEQTDSGLILIRYDDGTFESIW